MVSTESKPVSLVTPANIARAAAILFPLWRSRFPSARLAYRHARSRARYYLSEASQPTN